MSGSYKKLTLNDLDTDTNITGSLFVINHVNGNIVFVCPSSGGGKEAMIKIHDTWVPQDLSTVTKKIDIINAPDFRKLVSTKKIDVLSVEDALTILAGKDAQEENNKVFDIKEVASPTRKSSRTEEASATVISLVEKANSKEVSASDTLAVFRTSNFTIHDLKYIIKHCTVNMLRKYAAEKLTKG